MDMLKTGREGKFCKVNAVLTFREWLDDFASDATRPERVSDHDAPVACAAGSPMPTCRPGRLLIRL